ncbi:MAG: hypothetical protein H6590_06040 [Flavobacteriales bacterium]|nr:hypothetical protein [Flavobacteriales bacterium]
MTGIPGMTPGLLENPYAREQDQQKELTFGETLGDIAAAPFRGVAGAVTGVANLFGAGLDNPLGESQTMVGGFLEGLSQFLVGFIPGAGLLSRFGRLSKFAEAASIAKGAKTAAKAISFGRNVAAGAIADFAVFDSNDPRMSNLIQAFPGIQNPVTEFLASDPNSDPGDLTGRIKNVIEGAGMGIIADGVVSMFKAIKHYNGRVTAGDLEGAAKAEKEVERIANDVLDVPVDGVDAASRDLLEPESIGARKPENETYLDLPDPEAIKPGQDPKTVEHITQGMAQERIGYDPNGGTVLVASAQEGQQVMRAFSQFDAFVREPDARMQIVQLKQDVKTLSGRSSDAQKIAGKKPKGVSQAEYDQVVIDAAKRNGYDAVTFGKGYTQETVILNEDAVLKRLDIKGNEPFWGARDEARAIKDPRLVADSRLEAAVYNMELTPQQIPGFLDAVDKAVKDPSQEHLEAIAGVANLSKMGDRGQRALYKVFTEYFPFEKAPTETWDQSLEKSAVTLGKMTGMDPFIVSKQALRHSGNVDEAGRFAIAQRQFMGLMTKEIASLADVIHKWDSPSLTAEQQALKMLDGKELSKEAAGEMLARNLEGLQSLAMSFGSLRGSFGRGLNLFRQSAGRMSQNSLMRSLTLRASSPEHIFKTAQQISEDYARYGVEHAAAQIAQRTRKGRFVRGMLDYYMFSLLSAPKTLTTNVLGSAATSVFKPLETSLGAWVGKKLLDPKRAAEFERAQALNLSRFNILRTQLIDGLRVLAGGKSSDEFVNSAFAASRQARNTGAGQLVPEKAWQELGQLGQGDPAAEMGAALKIFKKVTETPGRLMVSQDEFLKQVSYHAHIKAELMLQANEQGLKGLEIDQWVDNEMRKMTLEGKAKTEAVLRDKAEQMYPRTQFADPENRQLHIESYIQKNMADTDALDGSTVNDRSGLMQRAVDFAREVTFTTPLREDRGLLSRAGMLMQKLADAHPMVRFFTPFIRTPLNILMFTADRLPVPGLNKDFVPFLQYLGDKMGILPDALKDTTSRFIQQVTSTNAEVAAEAYGRATTAVGVMSVIGGAAFAGVLTGSGPSDPEQRKVLEATGWQPYSIKVGDTYVSYQRLDPFASALAMASDIADVSRYGAPDQGLEDIAVGWLAATMENLSSKSYLTGLMDLMKLVSDPETQMSKTLGRIAGSLAVPNVIGAARGFTDDHTLEVQGILDRVKSRVPFMSNDVNVQRNMLGEPVNKKTFGSVLKFTEGVAGYLLPIQINTTGDDQVDQELADLAFPFRAPSEKKFGVDLRDYKNPKGQTAYDRWQELTSQVSLGGRTLRPALTRLINSHRYQALEKLPVDRLDLESPRIQMITDLVGQYRRAAERKMIEEFPDLKQHTTLQRQARLGLRSGTTNFNQLSSLLGGQ